MAGRASGHAADDARRGRSEEPARRWTATLFRRNPLKGPERARFSGVRTSSPAVQRRARHHTIGGTSPSSGLRGPLGLAGPLAFARLPRAVRPPSAPRLIVSTAVLGTITRAP